MTYKEAMKQCRKSGTAHAKCEALTAMYALMIAQMHGGDAVKYYDYLNRRAAEPEMVEVARAMLRDRRMAYDVLMGVGGQ